MRHVWRCTLCSNKVGSYLISNKQFKVKKMGPIYGLSAKLIIQLSREKKLYEISILKIEF